MSTAQLLVLEALSKAGVGVALLLIPGTLTRVLGLWRTDAGFWPRMVGALLLGIGIACALQDYLPARIGLGLAGAIAVNMSGAMTLLGLLVVGAAAPTLRGRIVLWASFAALVILALFEIVAARQ